MPSDAHLWTNPSVLAFAAEEDPLERAHTVAAELLALARSKGLIGRSTDVFALAALLGIQLRPKDDLLDAQIFEISPGSGELVIEYNPSRPRGRLRFSVAHEIAHSRFADVGVLPRHRTAAGSVPDATANDWELELVCDVIAADLLIPDEAVEGLLEVDPDIDFIMETRRRLDVSTEAVLRRLVAATPRALVMLATSRPAGGRPGAMRVDYLTRSDSSGNVGALEGLGHGDQLLDIQPLLDCSAVGQTSRGSIEISGETLFIQAVGVPAYPGSRWPRVLALLEPHAGRLDRPNFEFVSGDILDVPEGTAPVIFAHVVSDSVRKWNYFGVAGALAKAFPDFAQAFRAWTIASNENLTLGNLHFVDRQVNGRKVGVASLVVQEGFGGSVPRIRYDALEAALTSVADIAQGLGAEVHVPRLGAGQAGGRWDSIESALIRRLVDSGVKVVVHTRPADTQAPRASNA